MLHSSAESVAAARSNTRDWLVALVAASFMVGSCNCPSDDRVIRQIPDDATALQMVDSAYPDLVWSVAFRGDQVRISVTGSDGERADGVYSHSPEPL